jgi:hypothetical protein
MKIKCRVGVDVYERMSIKTNLASGALTHLDHQPLLTSFRFHCHHEGADTLAGAGLGCWKTQSNRTPRPFLPWVETAGY